MNCALTRQEVKAKLREPSIIITSPSSWYWRRSLGDFASDAAIEVREEDGHGFLLNPAGWGTVLAASLWWAYHHAEFALDLPRSSDPSCDTWIGHIDFRGMSYKKYQ